MIQASVKWSIDNLTRRAADGAVIVAHWRATAIAEEGEQTATSAQIGPASFPEPNPEDPNFIPYENLTEEQVVTWVKDKLGEEEVTRIETRLIQEASEKLTPTELSGTPWQAATEAPVPASPEATPAE